PRDGCPSPTTSPPLAPSRPPRSRRLLLSGTRWGERIDVRVPLGSSITGRQRITGATDRHPTGGTASRGKGSCIHPRPTVATESRHSFTSQRCPQMPQMPQMPPDAPHTPLAKTCSQQSSFVVCLTTPYLERLSLACLDLWPPPSAGSAADGSPVGTAADQSQRVCPIWTEGVSSLGEVYEFCSKAACCVPGVVSDRPSSWYGGKSQSRSRLG